MPHRTPHKTPETTRMTRRLPGWTKIRQDTDSIGWKIINVAHGLPHEHIKDTLRKLDNSQSLSTVDPLDVRQVYRVNLPENVGVDVVEASGFARVLNVDHVPILIKIVDNVEDFFDFSVTRFSHHADKTVTPNVPNTYDASGILGVEYIEGHPATPSGGYIVNYRAPAIWPSSTLVFDLDWQPASGYAYGIAHQKFDSTGEYEIIDGVGQNASTSGNLAYDPIGMDHLEILDIINLDASGNARVVPQDEYTLDANQIDFIDPSSLYVAEYSYQLFPWAKVVTTANSRNLFHQWGGSPIIATDPNNSNRISVVHGIAKSEGPALRVDPIDIRPSGNAQVKFKYRMEHDETWLDPSASGISIFITDENLVKTDDRAFKIWSDKQEVPKEWFPSEAFGGAIHISGFNLIDDPGFDGSTLWKSEGPDAQFISEHWVPSNQNQVISVSGGSVFTQEIPRSIETTSYLLTATLSISGHHGNLPAERGDPDPIPGSKGIIRTRWYSSEDEWNGDVNLEYPVTSISRTFLSDDTSYDDVNNVPDDFSGSLAYETITREIFPAFNSTKLKIELSASGAGLFYSDVKLEPVSVWGNNSRQKLLYDTPYRVQTFYDASKTYDVEPVQALSTASGVAHPYPFDWEFEDRVNTSSGEREPHIRPYTILPLADMADAVVDEMLPSGSVDNFEVSTLKEWSGITAPPEDRMLDEEHIDKRQIFLLERHNQVLHIQDIAGATVERVPLFCPDVRREGLNETVIPSGGAYYSPSFNPPDRAPFVSYEIHNDNPHDLDDYQIYREPRGIVYRNGALYVATAASYAASDYDANRSTDTSDYSIITSDGSSFPDAVIYKLNLWDKTHLHLTPPSGDMFPLFETCVNPTDMTWDRDGNLLIAQSGTILFYTPHVDVGMIDHEHGTAYFRELYRDNLGESGVLL
jgi:hypothetical protein